MFTIVNISIFYYLKKEAIVNDFNKHTMYTEHLPASLPENWIIAELDEDYEYLEFLGFDGEFLISLMPHPEESPSLPYFLTLSQLKGILGRFDFEDLEWPEWHANPAEAVRSAVDLMEWMNQNYGSFIPLTLEVWVSLGSIEQLELIQKHFEDELMIHEFEGKSMVFKRLDLIQGSNSYSDSALRPVSHFLENSQLSPDDLEAGTLTNERFELVEDLREKIRERINRVYPVG